MEILENVLSIVSIHTPTQGVTEGSSKVIIMDSSFNPHTHAGCDHGRAGGGVLPGMVSIHTPTQGVTGSGLLSHITKRVSIHTPTQGVTLIFGDLSKVSKFQSTHPRRV